MAKNFLAVLSPSSITISFIDDDGLPFTPDGGLTWSLHDDLGNVINSHLNESISPAEEITIDLDEDDEEVANNTAYRVFSLSGTYQNENGTQRISEKVYYRLDGDSAP